MIICNYDHLVVVSRTHLDSFRVRMLSEKQNNVFKKLSLLPSFITFKKFDNYQVRILSFVTIIKIIITLDNYHFL